MKTGLAALRLRVRLAARLCRSASSPSAFGTLEAGWQRLSPHLDAAARSLGARAASHARFGASAAASSGDRRSGAARFRRDHERAAGNTSAAPLQLRDACHADLCFCIPGAIRAIGCSRAKHCRGRAYSTSPFDAGNQPSLRFCCGGDAGQRPIAANRLKKRKAAPPPPFFSRQLSPLERCLTTRERDLQVLLCYALMTRLNSLRGGLHETEKRDQ